MNKKELARVYSKMSKEGTNIKEALKEIDIFTKTVEEALLIKGYIKFIRRGTFMILKKSVIKMKMGQKSIRRVNLNIGRIRFMINY